MSKSDVFLLHDIESRPSKLQKAHSRIHLHWRHTNTGVHYHTTTAACFKHYHNWIQIIANNQLGYYTNLTVLPGLGEQNTHLVAPTSRPRLVERLAPLQVELILDDYRDRYDQQINNYLDIFHHD